jgi:hypothetical protein
MLFRPEAFEPLTDDGWDDERVRAGIRELVADADRAYDPTGLWPADEWDAWQTPVPLKSLYVGAAGVLWALEALARRGHAETTLDLAAAALRTVEARRETPDVMAGVDHPPNAEATLFAGESGVLTVAWRLAPSDELADALFARVRENATAEPNEVMWGAPGTMLVARAMLDGSGDERWADAWRDTAEWVWGRREPDGLWPQRLWGSDARGLGPPHGATGNVLALLGGGDLLAPDRREALASETAAVLARTAVIEEGLANWPVAAGASLVGEDGQIRVQWCYGGPGVAVAAASYLDEELLLAGAELAWRAGPPTLEKGPCLCHGTAGNGYAFLKAFARTGDERWLERARRFAVHALAQVERLRADRGRGRYSLWTGDIGVALYAADCLDARTAYPVLDSVDW